MAKKARPRLVMADNIPITDLQSLKEHFDWEKALQYYRTGELNEWLRRLYLDEEADALEKLDSRSADFPKAFCAIFGVEYTGDKPYIPPSNQRTRTSAGQRRKAPMRSVVSMPRLVASASSFPSVAHETEQLADIDTGDDFCIAFDDASAEDALAEEDSIVTPITENVSEVPTEAVYARQKNPTSEEEEYNQNGDTARERRDYSKALEWYQKGASAGNAKAMYRIGQMSAKGQGCKKNNEVAIKWYKSAAAAGSVEAVLELETLQVPWEGVVSPLQNSQPKQQITVPQPETVPAQSNIALGNELYQNGDEAWNQKNYSDAIQCFQRAADLGNVNAMMAIGYAYLSGDGVAQSNQDSLAWFHKAVDLGSHDAMAAIGMLYEHGQLAAGKPDYSEALIWYTKAASAGNAMAMFLIAKMYDEGRGLDKDYNKAGEWYEKAAAAGSEKAVQELKQRKINMIAAYVFLAVVALVIAGIIYWFISS